jgi:hypothetical protein
MEWIVQLSMKFRVLLLVCLPCMAAVPAMTASGDYLGGGIQLGGSGTGVTVATTAITQMTTATIPPTTLPVTGSLSVTTTPAGATVFIDGVQRGVSPTTIPGLAPGDHTLLVKLNGYADLTAPVTITAGQARAYTTALSPAAIAANTPSKSAPTKTPGFEAVIGLSALGAVAALLLLRKNNP